MRIVVFGASGPTGRQLTQQAAASGHEVTGVSRRPIEPAPGVTTVQADATDPHAIAPIIQGADAVLSTIGGTFTRQPVSLYSNATTAIVKAMERYDVPRLLIVTSVLMDPAYQPTADFFYRRVIDPIVNRRLARTTHEDMRRAEAIVRASSLDWTIARPAGLFDHPAPTTYELMENHADGLFTARADLAAGMLAQVAEDKFSRRAMAVVTTEITPTPGQMIWQNITKK